MPVPVQITFHGLDHSDALEARIQERATELEQQHDRITRISVVVEAPHRKHHQGNTYSVRVEIHIPGREVVADHANAGHPSHEDAYIAVRDAFDAAARQLRDLADKRARGGTRQH